MTRHPVAGEAAMQELVGAIGERAATMLAQRFGGTSLYVPRTIGEHHPIAVAVGGAAAAALSSWAGGSAVSIPKQTELRARVIALRRRALTIVQIARETNYSERHVYRLLREDDDARQPGLFDDISPS